MLNTELKPCPFCGGKAELRRLSVQGRWSRYVRCPQCWASTDLRDDDEAAAACWNRRYGG